MPKVSVIVPIYGVEKYIERCARSLFAQTLDDIEFIFVNDCTKDRSVEILQEVIDDFKPLNVRIVHHNVNKGLPQARMTGILLAKGEYIANCDSDDWVDPKYCETLYNIAKKYDADMAICGFRYAGDDNTTVMSWGDESVYSDSELAFRHILAERLPINVWTRIVRRDIVQSPDIKVPVSYSAEDWTYVVQWAYYSKKIAFDSTPLYNYYVGESSQSRTSNPLECIKNCLQKRDNVNLIQKWLAEMGVCVSYREELISVKFLTKAMLFPVIEVPSCRRVWRRVFRNINLYVIRNQYVTSKEKSIHFKLLLGRMYPILIGIKHTINKNEECN